MMKRLKFRSNEISLGKFNRIIFDEPSLQSGFHPDKWDSKQIKFKRLWKADKSSAFFMLIINNTHSIY